MEEKMKALQILVLCCLLLCGAAVLSAQTPQWLWAVQAGGPTGGWGNYDAGTSIATDNQGNQYVTGYFMGISTFGSHTLTAGGYVDFFVAKLDPNGNWLWVVQAGGTNGNESCWGRGIAVDGAGNAYVTGQFLSTVNFGSHTLTSAHKDIFVAKLDTNGNWLWAVRGGGSSPDDGYGIAVDGAGNAYVTGVFFGTANFGGHTVSSPSAYAIFAAKMDHNGIWLWAAKAGGSSRSDDASGLGIAVDGADNSYVTGHFKGTVTFGSQPLTSSGYDDIFVAKLGPNGNWLWAAQAGGTNDDHGYGIAVDEAGNTHVTGYFNGTATFGSQTLTTIGGNDIFVAKLDPSGNWLRIVQAGGTGGETGRSIVMDSAGNAWVTGGFSGTATFGSHTLTSSGFGYGTYENIFVAKLDPSGDWLWAINGITSNGGKGIAVDGAGNACVTGYFGGTATIGNDSLTASGTSDIFIAGLGIHPGAGIPIAPGNLSIIISGQNVELDWGDVTVDQAGNQVSVDHYLVYYCATGPDGPFTVFGEDGSITQSQWTHSGAALLSPGFYYVTAVVAD